MGTDEPDQPGECPACGYRLFNEEEVIKEKFKEEIRSNELSRCPRCGAVIPEGESDAFLSFQEEIKERNALSYKEWLKRLRENKPSIY